MSPRWNANTVLLAVFLLILVGAGVDYGRKVLGGTTPDVQAPTTVKLSAPDFKKGDVAPDFALPDEKNKTYKLSELVKRETLLFFACGCANCRDVQSMLADMRVNNKSSVPPVITVTSSAPESRDAWIRDTKLEQTMLFWKAGITPDAMAIYKGKPCPRLYILQADRTVKFIGSSMNEVPGTEAISMEIATALGSPSRPGPVGAKGSPSVFPQAVPKALPSLPPYAQPQSALPGGETK